MGCFRAFVWHLSLPVVAAREHLWRSSLRGVGGDSGECPMGGTASCSRAGMAALRCVMGLGFEGGGWGEWTNLCNVVKAAQPCTLWAPPIAVMISTGVGCRLQICRRGDPQRFDSAFAVLFFSLKSGPFLCQDPTPLHPSGSDLSKEGRKTVF